MLPLHHPIRVAEQQWATLDLLSNGQVDFAVGRGSTGASTRLSMFGSTTTRASSKRARTGAETLVAYSHHGQRIYSFDDVSDAQAGAGPDPDLYRLVLETLDELAARLEYDLVVAPFAAAISYGGLRQVADLHETCAKHGRKPGRLMCSYFTHFTTTSSRRTRSARGRSATIRSA